MRRHSEISHLVHRRRADLNFHHLSVQIQRRVEGLVPIGLGERDVILHTRWDGLKAGQMLDQSQDMVAQPNASIGHVLLGLLLRRGLWSQNDSQRHDVGNVVQILGHLGLHLVPQRVQLLGPSHHLNLGGLIPQGGVGLQCLLQYLLRLVERVAELGLVLPQLAVQPPVFGGVEVHEGRVLQLRLELPDAHPVGQRREDVERLPADLHLLLGLHVLEGAHVVEPVGQLHDDDPVVLRHGDEHLAQVLRLLVGVVVEDQRGQLRHLGLPLDDGPDDGTEHGLDLGEGEVGVLDGVVEEAGRHGLGVHLQPRQEEGHLDGMDDEGLAGLAPLLPVGPVRHPQGLVDQEASLGAQVGHGGHYLAPVPLDLAVVEGGQVAQAVVEDLHGLLLGEHVLLPGAVDDRVGAVGHEGRPHVDLGGRFRYGPAVEIILPNVVVVGVGRRGCKRRASVEAVR